MDREHKENLAWVDRWERWGDDLKASGRAEKKREW